MRRAFPFLLGLGCLLALLLACFGRVLLRGEQFGYRDAAHFYYPLYQRVQQEWAKGRLPLWDASENAGMPLLGNPTAAVLYPGKVIYAALPYPWAARVYPIAHVILALAGMYRLLRGWGTSRAGSLLAGIAYAFAAPVMFQYCNIIYLVGAAWVPWGLHAADQWLRTGRRAAIAWLAVTLAMQTLGGDPEAAYLVGLCSGGYALGLALVRRRLESGAAPVRVRTIFALLVVALIVWTAAVLWCAKVLPPMRDKGPPRGPLPMAAWFPRAVAAAWAAAVVVWLAPKRRSRGPLLTMLVGLAGGGALAALLCSAQLLPTVEFTRQTMRASLDGPHDIYPFAIEPYRLAEFVWPEVFGSNRVGNRTWGVLIPPRHKSYAWVPSLAMGGLTVVLALSALSLRGLGARRVWLSWIAVISIVASLGEYAGPLWIARNVPAVAAVVGAHDPFDAGAIRVDGMLRDGDGSVYNLMALALPGFAGFRYPGKILTFTCLAIAGLAGIGFDRVVAGRWRGALSWGIGLGGLGLALTLALQFGSAPFLGWLRAREAMNLKGLSLFGPFDPEGAWSETRHALLHGTVAMMAAAATVLVARRSARWGGAVALLVVATDVALANSVLVFTVPQSVFEEPPELLRQIAQAEAADPSPGPFRIHRMGQWEPTGFFAEGSPDRHREMTAWERNTLQPKYAIPLKYAIPPDEETPRRLAYTFTEGVAELYDYAWFFAPFTVNRDLSGQGRATGPNSRLFYFPRRAFDLWATRYFIVPSVTANNESRGAFSFLVDSEPVRPTAAETSGPNGDAFKKAWERDQDWRLLRNRREHPRAWIVHSVEVGPPIEGTSREARAMRQALFEAMLYTGGSDLYWNTPGRQAKDLRAMAFVETLDPNPLPGPPPSRPDPSEVATIAVDDDQKVVIEADLKSDGLVVLADVYYPGWELYIDGEKAPIYRTNRMMRGALVPAGRHRLAYIYNPKSVRLGLAISTGGLILTGGFLLSCRRHRMVARLSDGF